MGQIISLKRRASYLVENAPERPNVGLEVIAVLIDAFGRHVVGRADERESHASALAKEPAQAEIAQLNSALSRYEHIGRLQVAMHHTPAVHVLESAAYLQKILPHCLLRY